MTETLTKADKRNLRQTVGKAAAEAVDSVRNAVTRIELAHQVLARQMLEFETTAARLVESRAVDQRTVAALREQVESAHAKIGDERTHRLNLADEQRAYVDGADLAVERRMMTVMNARRDAVVDAVAAQSQRMTQLENPTWRERLRWLFAGKFHVWGHRTKRDEDRPILRKVLCQHDDAPQSHVARDAHEAAWTDLGRPADL
jgi:hypothetical protein